MRNEIIEVDLGEIPLESAVAAFDSWVGLHVRVREALSRKPALTTAELGGVSAVDLGHESVAASRAALEELRHRLIAQLPL